MYCQDKVTGFLELERERMNRLRITAMKASKRDVKTMHLSDDYNVLGKRHG